MNCPHCQSANTREYDKRTRLGYRIFRCHGCDTMFNERTGTAFNELQCPTDIVMLVVLWRIRYKLSLRDLVEMFVVRGYEFTHETVRDWEARFAPLLTEQLRAKRRGQAGKSWYVDETYLKVHGQWHYLHRAIDREDNLVDTMLSTTRDLAAAKAFFKQAVATVGHKPKRVTTDKHVAYPRAIRRVLGRKVLHRISQYLNNRIEQGHRGVKQRYYPMRGFGSYGSAARFCSAFDEVRHHFRTGSTTTQTPSLSERRETFRQRWGELSAVWQTV
ncbi:MAG: IS6 family transposase [Aggregatilineales bacterium]